MSFSCKYRMLFFFIMPIVANEILAEAIDKRFHMWVIIMNYRTIQYTVCASTVLLSLLVDLLEFMWNSNIRGEFKNVYKIQKRMNCWYISKVEEEIIILSLSHFIFDLVVSSCCLFRELYITVADSLRAHKDTESIHVVPLSFACCKGELLLLSSCPSSRYFRCRLRPEWTGEETAGTITARIEEVQRELKE